MPTRVPCMAVVTHVGTPCVAIPCMAHSKLHKMCMFHATGKHGPHKHEMCYRLLMETGMDAHTKMKLKLSGTL